MGMAASQVRLLQLTSRKNTIGRELTSLSLQKNSLSSDMKRVSLEYQNALSSKTLKWTLNSGATYVDLTYANLMTPNATNANNPYLITNSAGKVVIDNKYLDYAKMISPDGAEGGTYEGETRAQILSELTGISPDIILEAESANKALSESDAKVNKLQEQVDIAESKCRSVATESDFISKGFGIISKGNVANCVDSGTTWALAATKDESKAAITSILNEIKTNMKYCLTENDYKKFEEACSQTATSYSNMLDAEGIDENSGTPVYMQDDVYQLNTTAFISQLLEKYTTLNANGWCANASNSNMTNYYMVDISSSSYLEFLSLSAQLEAAKAENTALINSGNQILTASEESQIAFYDKLFQSIADNGWMADISLSDNEYLNNMLQNNLYYITTVTSGDEENEYESHIASTFSYIVSVNDTAAQTEAQAKYEYEKSIINEKEQRIDTRMQNLETEQSAIKAMIQGIESVKNDNSERAFSIMS